MGTYFAHRHRGDRGESLWRGVRAGYGEHSACLRTCAFRETADVRSGFSRRVLLGGRAFPPKAKITSSAGYVPILMGSPTLMGQTTRRVGFVADVTMGAVSQGFSFGRKRIYF